MSGQWAVVLVGATWRVAMTLPDGTQLFVTKMNCGHPGPRAYRTIESATYVADAINIRDDLRAASTTDLDEFQAQVAGHVNVLWEKSKHAFKNRGKLPCVCSICGRDFLARPGPSRGRYCSLECAGERGLPTLSGRWLPSERTRLAEMSRTMTNREIGLAVGRSTCAVENELRRMRIVRPLEFYLSRPDLAHLAPQAYPKELKEVIALQKQITRRLHELTE